MPILPAVEELAEAVVVDVHGRGGGGNALATASAAPVKASVN